mgnify:CR=1 FL=1
MIHPEAVLTGAQWWLEPPHRWMGAREQERADTEFVERIGTHFFWAHYYLGARRADAPQTGGKP